MYLLTHLMVGIIFGIALSHIFQENRLILFCATGSILPDLIDKTIGILLFYQKIGYGRIYCHTILLAALISLIGIAQYLRSKDSGIFLFALVTGIFLHQLLDAMWIEPINWFWPIFGHFIGHSRPDFFWNSFWSEIANPFEWLAGCIIIASVIYMVIQIRQRHSAIL